jgi:hypothetical protein
MEGLAVLAAVVASLSAGGWLVFRRLRRPGVELIASAPAAASAAAPRRAGPPPIPTEPALVCPTCRREYPAGLRFCLQDARPLIPADGAEVTGEALACRICRRSFEPGTRFCPFDAEELGPANDRARAAAVAPAPGDDRGKICPHCTARFGAEERFCGRDGAELAPLN